VISGINSALSGLDVFSGMVNAAAGNLANLNTTGYQSARLEIGALGASGQRGNEVGQGAMIMATAREGANVDPAREMISLIIGQRGYQANIKSLRTASDLLGSVLDTRA